MCLSSAPLLLHAQHLKADRSVILRQLQAEVVLRDKGTSNLTTSLTKHVHLVHLSLHQMFKVWQTGGQIPLDSCEC